MDTDIENEINKIRWERWRAKQKTEREKTYFHCWSDCNVVSGPYIDFCINYKRSGQSNCQGGTGSWIDISDGPCIYNMAMRFARAGESSGFYDVLSQCYWREKSGCPEHCYMEVYGWNKPIRSAFVGNNSIPFGHWICAEHLGGDVTNFNNWNFFQYSNLNIPPGDPNLMPHGTATENTAVRIREITSIGSCGGSVRGDYVACFEIDKDCIVISVSCPP